jgi:hypothetical protein
MAPVTLIFAACVYFYFYRFTQTTVVGIVPVIPTTVQPSELHL